MGTGPSGSQINSPAAVWQSSSTYPRSDSISSPVCLHTSCLQPCLPVRKSVFSATQCMSLTLLFKESPSVAMHGFRYKSKVFTHQLASVGLSSITDGLHCLRITSSPVCLLSKMYLQAPKPVRMVFSGHLQTCAERGRNLTHPTCTFQGSLNTGLSAFHSSSYYKCGLSVVHLVSCCLHFCAFCW